MNVHEEEEVLETLLFRELHKVPCDVQQLCGLDLANRRSGKSFWIEI